MPEQTKELFDKVIDLGIKYDSHYSDLYLPVNEQTTELLKEYDLLNSASVSQFTSQLPDEKGSQWYDIAFKYLPYWYNKAGTRVNGYTIRFNDLWNHWIVSHDEIGAGLTEFTDINFAIDYCNKG